MSKSVKLFIVCLLGYMYIPVTFLSSLLLSFLLNDSLIVPWIGVSLAHHNLMVVVFMLLITLPIFYTVAVVLALIFGAIISTLV